MTRRAAMDGGLSGGQGGHSMQQIHLSQEQIAVLDDEDYARLQHFNWIYRGEREDKPGYAIRHHRVGERKYKTVYLHREVVGQVPKGHEVIFRNGDRLDCRRENLLVVTIKEARQHHLRARKDSQTHLK